MRPSIRLRFSATGRKYLYRVMANGSDFSLFEKGRVWNLQESLDVEKMKVATFFSHMSS